MDRIVKWNFRRRFGIEYEFGNSSSEVETMANVVDSNGGRCRSRTYEHTRENSTWVAKTDSSCGYSGGGCELVTPILSGPDDLKFAAELLVPLREAGFGFNNRAGNHVHVEIADYNFDNVSSLVAHWVKIERFIMNGTPACRHNNGYCRQIENVHYSLRANHNYTPNELWECIRYGRDAINFGNFSLDRDGRNSRGTVEFRFGEMTHDPEVIKNRVRFLIWIVEACRVLPFPDNLNWYSPKQVLSVFGLLQKPNSAIKLHFSPAIQSMRKWLLQRLIDFAPPEFDKDRIMCQTLLADINTEQELMALSD